MCEKNGNVQVSVWNKYKLLETEEKVLERRDSDGAEVGTVMGTQLNIGNYQSIWIEAKVKIPCNKEEIATGFEAAWKVAYVEVDKKRGEIRAKIKKVKQQQKKV